MLRRHRFASFPLARLLSARHYRASRLRQAPTVAAAAVLLLIALALSAPVLPYSERKVTSRGVDLALVLDLSSSMQELMGGKQGAATRLVTTKKALIDFIARRPDELARMKLERGSGRQVMVVFTDGEHNFGEDPLVTLAKADEAGTRVHMVGIDLNEVAKTRPAVLKLADAVRGYGGRYYDATSGAQLHAASASIDSLEKGTLVQTRYVRNRPVFCLRISRALSGRSRPRRRRHGFSGS